MTANVPGEAFVVAKARRKSPDIRVLLEYFPVSAVKFIKSVCCAQSSWPSPYYNNFLCRQDLPFQVREPFNKNIDTETSKNAQYICNLNRAVLIKTVK